MISLQIASDFDFPFVTIGKQLFLVVKQLFVCLCSIFEVGSFHNGVHRTSLLTKSAINALHNKAR